MARRWIDHTADFAVELSAPDLPALLVEASRAFAELLCDVSRVQPAEVHPVRVEASGPEDLLVAWLEELIFLHDTRALLPAEVTVVEATPRGAAGLVRGEPVDPARHRVHREIKAATFHDLRIRSSPSGELTACVVFDT